MIGSFASFELTPTLKAVLWTETVIYLGIGVAELFNDFFERPKPWMTLNGRVNGYLRLNSVVGHKMHAVICVLLGFTALNGLIEGRVSRFEIEFIFLGLALLMSVIWSTKFPGWLGVAVIATKPEFWLQIVMAVFCLHLIRPEIAVICVGLNLWGVFVLLARGKQATFVPYTPETVIRDIEEAMGERTARALSRLVKRR